MDKTVSDINARVRQKYGTPIHSVRDVCMLQYYEFNAFYIQWCKVYVLLMNLFVPLVRYEGAATRGRLKIEIQAQKGVPLFQLSSYLSSPM